MLKKQLLFAFAGTGKEEHRAAQRFPPGASCGELRGVRRGVELEVSAHLNARRTERTEALGVGAALRAHRRKRRERRPRESPRACIAASELPRHARIGKVRSRLCTPEAT